MRLLNQLRKEMIYLKATWVYILIGFFVGPILLGLMYGNIYEKMMSTDIKLETLTLYVAGEKDTETYKALYPILEQEFVQVIEVEEANINKYAEKGKNALGLLIEKSRVELINYGGESSEKRILRNMIQMSSANLSHEAVDNNHLVTTRILEQEKRLNSYELFVVAVYTAMSFFIAVTLATNFVKERQQSMLGRLFSINISKEGYYLRALLSVFCISFMMILLYSVIALKMLLGLDLHWMKLFMVNGLHAGFITAVYSLFISIFQDEKVLKTYVTPIIMVIMILGGSFFPVDAFESPIKIATYMPNYCLLHLYKGVLLSHPLNEMSTSMGILVGMTFLCFFIGFLRFPKMEIS